MRNCRICYQPVQQTVQGNVETHWDSAGNAECPGNQLPYSKCLAGPRPNRGGFTAERRNWLIARVVELTVREWSNDAIAAALGICKRTVQRYRVSAEVATPRARAMSADEIREAKELLADGCSYAEVGRTLGREPKSLRRRFPGYVWNRAEANRLRDDQARLEAL